MKGNYRVLLLSALMIASIAADAQTSAEFYQKKINKSHSIRNMGIVTAVAGIPAVTIGAYLVHEGDKEIEKNDFGPFFIGMDKLYKGTVLVYLGGAAITGGAVMIIIGNKKKKQYQEKLDGLKVGIYCTPDQAGLTLTFRF